MNRKFGRENARGREKERKGGREESDVQSPVYDETIKNEEKIEKSCFLRH